MLIVLIAFFVGAVNPLAPSFLICLDPLPFESPKFIPVLTVLVHELSKSFVGQLMLFFHPIA